MDDLLPYNQKTDIFLKDYPPLKQKTIKIPDTQNYWEAPITEKVIEKEIIKEKDLKIDENIKIVNNKINITSSNLDGIKKTLKIFKYILLIIILILIYIIIYIHIRF